ncbi:unnamed protein product, partial [Brassica oleracea var. botrytis]
MQLRRVKSKGVRDERDRYSRVEEEEEEDGQGFCRDAPLAYQNTVGLFIIVKGYYVRFT